MTVTIMQALDITVIILFCSALALLPLLQRVRVHGASGAPAPRPEDASAPIHAE
jgi:hypothetical protein